MAKIAFIGSPAHGHTNPTLPVVQELVRRGEDVYYYSIEEFSEKIQATGARFVAYESILGNMQPERFKFGAKEIGNIFTLARLVLEGAVGVLPDLIEHIRQNTPDLLVHDAVSVWGKILGRQLGIPAASSITTVAINRQSSSSSFQNNLKVMRMLLQDATAVYRCLNASRILRSTYGYRYRQLLDIFSNAEDLNLVYTSATFQPAARSFPSSYRFVGPSIPDVEDPPDFPWGRLEKRPVILITMGTIFCKLDALYLDCIHAFRDWPGTVVLAVGHLTDIDSLGELPDNFLVRNYVPQLSILKRASLHINHGGMNSVSEGIFYRVPQIIIPQGADQFIVAMQVQKLGAGVVLSKQSVTAERLREAADTVLGSATFLSAAAHISDSFRQAGGYRRAADELLAYARERGIQGI